MQDHAGGNQAEECDGDNVRTDPPPVGDDLPIGHQEGAGQSEGKYGTGDDAT